MSDSNNRPPVPPDENPWRALALVSGIGIDLGVMLWLGYWVGTKYDQHQGTEFGYLVGLLVGLAVGVVTVAGLIRKYTGAGRK